MGEKVLQIAIDGPVASGKSTVAKALAEKLNLLYIDTGAMYRALALSADEEHIAWSDVRRIEKLVDKVEIELRRPGNGEKDGRGVTVELNGKDVTWEIRTQNIAEGASVVSQYQHVREVLGEQQQQAAMKEPVVMEGRDIGTRVLKDASLKIFMTADVEKRVGWKQAQMKGLGEDISVDEVRKALMMRDEREMGRKNDPLRPAEGAWILDTTDLTIDRVVKAIVGRVRDLGFVW
jgi:cytidylate kinase